MQVPLLSNTSVMLYRFTSHKSLDPISVPIYQPLNGAAGNWMPPQSNSMLATAGSAYHFSPSSLNQVKLSISYKYQTSESTIDILEPFFCVIYGLSSFMRYS